MRRIWQRLRDLRQVIDDGAELVRALRRFSWAVAGLLYVIHVIATRSPF
jgi:hypothetical protein